MQHGIRKVFLHPGDFIFGEPGTHIHTVLGSCIAICLWHPQLHIGGMCHFVLPSRPKGDARGAELNGRYGDEAVELFDMALKLHQTEYAQYQAKIFGGANMFSKKSNSDETLIGEKNSAAAMRLLMDRKASIEVVHVGEQGHRRIVMDITSGDVWVKYKSVANEVAMTSQNGRN